jgi:predicted dehydrogenase
VTTNDPTIGKAPMPPTRVAIVGCGYWGANYVRVFGELPDAEVRYVCDQSRARLNEIRRRKPDVVTLSDAREAIDAPDVDAVVIATEASSHYDLVRSCLDAGKDVLVEKPLATTGDRADELVNLADECGLLLMVGHTFLYNAGVRLLKELTASPAFGRLYYLYAQRTSLGPVRRDVNAIWDLAPHDIAIFNYVLDSLPESVSAVGARLLHNAREDVGFIALEYPSGVVAHIHVSWTDPSKVRQVVAVGSDQRIVFNDLDALERVRVFEKGVRVQTDDPSLNFGELQLLVRDGAIVSPAIGSVVEPLKHQSGHFLHCVRRGERPLTDARQGRDVVRIIEAIDRSLARRGAPERVEIPAAANASRESYARAVR